ncbi:hypothetical protein RugamoR57_04530 [Duganella caerulea]
MAETWLAMAKAPPASSEMRDASAVPMTLEAIANPNSTSSGQARLNMGGVRIGVLAAGMWFRKVNVANKS